MLGKWDAKKFPVGQINQESWFHGVLLHIAHGMAITGAAAQTSDQVVRILASVVAGKEPDRSRWLLQFVDFEGSEVRVKDGAIYDGTLEATPYMACIWNWNCTKLYLESTSTHQCVRAVDPF